MKRGSSQLTVYSSQFRRKSTARKKLTQRPQRTQSSQRRERLTTEFAEGPQRERRRLAEVTEALRTNDFASIPPLRDGKWRRRSGRDDKRELGSVGAEVAVVAGDFPEEEDVFGFGTLTDVVDYQVTAGG